MLLWGLLESSNFTHVFWEHENEFGSPDWKAQERKPYFNIASDFEEESNAIFPLQDNNGSRFEDDQQEDNLASQSATMINYEDFDQQTKFLLEPDPKDGYFEESGLSHNNMVLWEEKPPLAQNINDHNHIPAVPHPYLNLTTEDWDQLISNTTLPEFSWMKNTSCDNPLLVNTSLCHLSGYPMNWPVLLLGMIVLAGLIGNSLVCIAIIVEKKLRSVTNSFLMSLAVADLLVSVLVMPCSIIHQLMGYWPFGLVLCDLWQVADVMLCTSSIMHMCVISIDRYIRIKEPLKTRTTSKQQVALKILVVWLIAFAIASPIIFLGIYRPKDVLTADLQCGISNPYFIVYGSLAAFFIPLFLMLASYSFTIHILRQKINLGKKQDGGGLRRMKTRKARTYTCLRKHYAQLNGPLAQVRNRMAISMERKSGKHDNTAPELEPLNANDKDADNKKNTVLSALYGAAQGLTVPVYQPLQVTGGVRISSSNTSNSTNSIPVKDQNNVLTPGLNNTSQNSTQPDNANQTNHCSAAADNNKPLVPEKNPIVDNKCEENGLVTENTPFLSDDTNGICLNSEQGYCVSQGMESNEHNEKYMSVKDKMGSLDSQDEVPNLDKSADQIIPKHVEESVESPEIPGSLEDIPENNTIKTDQVLNDEKVTDEILHIPLKVECINGDHKSDTGLPGNNVKYTSPETADCVMNSTSSLPSTSQNDQTDTTYFYKHSTDLIHKQSHGSLPHVPKITINGMNPGSQDSLKVPCNVKDKKRNSCPNTKDSSWGSNQSSPPRKKSPWARLSHPDTSLASLMNPLKKCAWARFSHPNVSSRKNEESPKDKHEPIKPEVSSTQPSAPRFKALVKKHSAAFRVAAILTARRETSMRTVKTEQKAVKVLGAMFSLFFICWAPFFTLNLALGICYQKCSVDNVVFSIFLWLGYLSSILNPIIYTVFNRLFKETFLRLVKCKVHSRCLCSCKCLKRHRKGVQHGVNLIMTERGPLYAANKFNSAEMILINNTKNNV